MRGILLLTIVFGPVVCYCDGSKKHDGLTPLDPSRPIYQKKDGFPSKPITWPILGGLKKVRLPDPVSMQDFEDQLKRQEMRHKQEVAESTRELKLHQQQREMRIGGLLKVIGWGLVILGIAGHCITALPILKSWATSIMTLGVGGIVGGMAIQKTVEFDKYATILVVLLVAGVVMYVARNWSLSHLPGNIRALLRIKPEE